MRGQDLLEKIEGIDPAYVEAADAKPKAARRWVKWGALASCAVLSCPEMTVGNAYTVSVGGQDVGTFTLSSLVQSSGVSGGMNGPGGMFPGGKR